MITIKISTSLLLIAPLALTSLAATQEGERKPTTPPTPAAPSPAAVAPAKDYVYLDDILGANVAIAAGAEARREAAEDKKTAKPESGELDDLIVDQQTGAIECAIVSFGGFLGMGDKTVALPVHLFTWNAVAKRFDANVDIDQLKALPACDLKEARKSGLDRALSTHQAAWANAKLRSDTRAVEASGDRKRTTGERKLDTTGGKLETTGDRKVDTTAEGKAGATKSPGLPVSTVRWVAASDLDDPEVYTANGTDKFGKVSKVIVDRAERRVAFFVVSHGGALGIGDTEYLVACDSVTPCQKGDDLFYCIDRTAEDMKTNGVRYEKPKHGVVDDTVVERTRRSSGGR